VGNRTSGGGRRTRAKTQKIPEGHLPRKTEVARNQITSSNVANGTGGILEWHTKVKNHQASVARSSSEYACLSPWSPSRYRVFLRTWLTTATSLETQLPSNSASSASTISEIKLFASAYSRLAETSRVVYHWSSQCTEKFWHDAVPKNRETPAKRIGHFPGMSTT
jgi:hypothetical protein